MFKMMRIREKLALALTVPLLAVIGLSGFVIVLSDQQADEALRRSQDIAEEVTLATSGLSQAELQFALQVERNSQALFLMGADVSAVANDLGARSRIVEPAQARAATDAALGRLRADVAASTPAVREIFEPVLATSTSVDAIRRQIDASTEERVLSSPLARQSFAMYSEFMGALFDANSKVAVAVDDATLRNGAALIDLSARQRTNSADLIAELAQTPVPFTDMNVAMRIATLRTREASVDQEMARTSGQSYQDIVRRSLSDPRLTEYHDTVHQLVDLGTGSVLTLIGPTSVKVWDAYEELDGRIGAQLRADADAMRSEALQRADDAQQRRSTVILAGLAALLAASAVTYVAARSISRPLARLARDAEDMADRRLPGAVKSILETPLGEDVVLPELAPVPTGGGREVHEVADALNSVQTSAASLAVEQAVLRRNISDSFINLGRRNQNLLSRLLDSITQMEREEADSRLLERLFSIDHLATRMRRNAESLLLLAGLEPHRQWSAPVPIIQVIRGAMGEVEHYRRISLRSLDEAHVKGSAAADIAHLVAELLENALRFSPPDREVEVMGRVVDGDYQLAIVDSGLGMTDRGLAEANRRLSGQESFTVAPSRYLGHYVVGVQAARLGVQVRLQPSPGSGVTAHIMLGDARAEPEPAGTDAAAPAPVRPEIVERAAGAHPSPTTPASPRPVAPAAPIAQAAVTASVTTEPPRTASGYRKRQRGTHVPRTEVSVARGDAVAGAVDGTAPVDKAASVRNLLSGLQAGADRARGELERSTHQEDGDDRS